MTDAAPARDPGLQPERTRLAWTRTALALVLNAVLVVRSGIVHDLPVFTVIGAGLIVAAAAEIAIGVRRARALAEAGRVAVDGTAVLFTTGIAMVAAVAGVASILLAG
ncbi:DUF202 domain-containing protein [Rathayibacter sp. YIM 133350]|uniref:DUF202 domain-containing protein n=1 Tax=Rathayibacter sp. YIM 133350 TaxID=3131992 RepID=UPI00307DBBA1